MAITSTIFNPAPQETSASRRNFARALAALLLLGSGITTATATVIAERSRDAPAPVVQTVGDAEAPTGLDGRASAPAMSSRENSARLRGERQSGTR